MKLLTRHAALLAVILPLATSSAQRAVASKDSQTVVFVCEHGTVKSVLAMSLFRQMARERNLPIRAVSRGTAPDASVPPFMTEGLQKDGLTLGAFTPTAFSVKDVMSAMMVVSFDQPSVRATVAGKVPTAAWNDLPAVSANYAVARDSIRLRVTRLVDSLARAARTR